MHNNFTFRNKKAQILGQYFNSENLYTSNVNMI